MHIRKPHSNCSSDGIPKIIMSRHVLIALPEAFNGWAYWTHYEKKMNMSQDEKKMNMSDGSTSEASSWDMTQDELDEMNRATRLPLPTPGVDKKLDSGVDKGLTSCSESPTSSSMSSSPNGKQESSLLSAEFPHLAPHVDGYHTFVQQMGGLESRHFEHWKQIDTRFTEKACILRGSLMAKIAKDIPVTTHVLNTLESDKQCILRFNRDLRVEDDRMPALDESQVEYSCVSGNHSLVAMQLLTEMNHTKDNEDSTDSDSTDSESEMNHAEDNRAKLNLKKWP